MFAFAIKKVKRNTVENHEDLLAKKRLMHFMSREKIKKKQETRLCKEEGDEEGKKVKKKKNGDKAK